LGGKNAKKSTKKIPLPEPVDERMSDNRGERGRWVSRILTEPCPREGRTTKAPVVKTKHPKNRATRKRPKVSAKKATHGVGEGPPKSPNEKEKKKSLRGELWERGKKTKTLQPRKIVDQGENQNPRGASV